MDEDFLYPEKVYFRRSIIIGNLPKHLDFNILFNYFDDINFWKSTGKKLIPDFQNPDAKAAILIYENDEAARICKHQFQTMSNSSFIVYHGISLFYYCLESDRTCDARSRNVLLSGIDREKPKNVYLDHLGMFGKIRFCEFCLEGEIPKVRVEFTRVTSSFAAVLTMQHFFGGDSVMSLEVPLFPVHPIGPIQCDSTAAPTTTLDHNHAAEEMKEQAFMLCTMNFYQDHHNFTANNGIPEDAVNENECVEECMMEAVSFGISRKLLRDKISYPHIPKYMRDYFDRNAQENLKRVLQSTKKIVAFNNVWKEMMSPLVQQMM